MVSAGNLFSVTQIQKGKCGWLFLSYHQESANWLVKFSHNGSSNSSLPSAPILSYLSENERGIKAFFRLTVSL